MGNKEVTKDESITEEKKEKCFVIMPISDQGDYPSGHFTKVYEQIIKPAILSAGYEPYRVDENKISDSIIDKIFDAIQNCPMAVCDLSNNNPNVMYELGLRQAYDKPVVLIKDEKTNRVFDISAIDTVPYSSNRLYEEVLDAQNKISEAITATANGKRTSLLKVLSIQKAQYSDVEISHEDKNEILLKSILNKLNNLSLDSHYEPAPLKYESNSMSFDQKFDELYSITTRMKEHGECNDAIWQRLLFEASSLLSELHSGKYTPLFIDINMQKVTDLQNIIIQNMPD